MNGKNETQSKTAFLPDALDQKLMDIFPGRVVRKDIVHKLKVGFSIPVFVLEYLLGKPIRCIKNLRNR
jgi:predicted ATP-dependent Lon-type protease